MTTTYTSADAVASLQQQAAKITLERIPNVIRFIPQAALLAAMGNESELSRLKDIGELFKQKVERAIIDEAKGGRQELDNETEEFLAFNILRAQEWRLFVEYSPFKLSVAVCEAIQKWVDKVETFTIKPRDHKCVMGYLKGNKELFPLPPHLTLKLVAQS